jgi:hypothetical protein
MSETSPLRHLVIHGAGMPPHAGSPRSSAQPVPLVLPNLQRLMQHMALSTVVACDDDSLALPYELVLAQLNGLPAQPGLTPWAAFESGTIGTPCAWVKPCHWQVGADHVLLSDPAQLQLDEATSRALMLAATPYFEEDGITLSFRSPTAWLATGEVFRGLPTRSLDRVLGQRITPAIFDASTAAGNTLRRLQNEMQMLFYTHPASDERQARGLQAVNSFWITGAGVLDQAVQPATGVRVETRLSQPQLQHDAQAHAAAWREVDADVCAQLLAQLKHDPSVQLTLCGAHRAHTYRVSQPSLLRRIQGLFGHQPSSALLSQL